MSAAARPLVAVRKLDAADSVSEQVALPHVFLAPIRSDIVSFVHTNMAKNKRQAYAVSEGAGHQHSAESWGTGRAVARVPRVSGGGTSRAGQGAFANQCRKGRMFAPTKTWRKWHRKINVNQKRYATASALAASALPALVMARGHRVENVPEVPLVLDNAVESLQKTKQAISALKAVGAYDDVLKAKASRKLRRGKGKMRNRRHVSRRGPLVVYQEDQGIVRAFRNLPGVELVQVDRLNLLQLAPGGHLGRFCVWTKSAFSKLADNWGSFTRESTQKTGYKLPLAAVSNSDLTRVINSDEIQSKLRPANKAVNRYRLKKNPLKNFGVMVKLNPYALALRRSELLTQERRAAAKSSAVDAKRKSLDKKHEKTQRENYKRLVQDNLYAEPSETVVDEDVKVAAAVATVRKARKEKKRPNKAEEAEEAAAAEAAAAKKDAKGGAKAAPAKAAAPAAKAAPKK